MKEIIIDGIRYNLIPIEGEEFNDWRLPTIDELKTLTKSNLGDIDEDNANYWSSSSIDDTNYAWAANLYYGSQHQGNKSNYYRICCVREGRTGLEWSATSENTMTYNEAIEYAKNLVAPVYYKDK